MKITCFCCNGNKSEKEAFYSSIKSETSNMRLPKNNQQKNWDFYMSIFDENHMLLVTKDYRTLLPCLPFHIASFHKIKTF